MLLPGGWWWGVFHQSTPETLRMWLPQLKKTKLFLVTCTLLTLNVMGLNYKYLIVERDNITWKIDLPVCNSHDQHFMSMLVSQKCPFSSQQHVLQNCRKGVEHEAREQSCTNTIIGLAFYRPVVTIITQCGQPRQKEDEEGETKGMNTNEPFSRMELKSPGGRSGKRKIIWEKGEGRKF